MYDALENAAKLVAAQSEQQATQYIEYKYGEGGHASTCSTSKTEQSSMGSVSPAWREHACPLSPPCVACPPPPPPAEAGSAAKQSVPVLTDMMNATLNFTRLGARAFISKTAKRTAKM